MHTNTLAGALPPTNDVSAEIRQAVELSVRTLVNADGQIHATIHGPANLVDLFDRYAPRIPHGNQLVAIGADRDEIARTVRGTSPSRVVVICDGPLARLLRPLRIRPQPLGEDCDFTTWQCLGYQRLSSRGVRGPASIAWAVGQRALSRMGRPDLADRCRIAMQRSLIASNCLRWLAITSVREYRRVR